MNQLQTKYILLAVLIVSALPFLLVELFPFWLYHVMGTDGYLVFHNVAELFSVMVSLSIFGVGWFSFDQSQNRHVLFLSASFLAVGLMDSMHALGYTGMPAFVTPNSITKASQYWIAARFVDASAFLASAFIYPYKPNRWLSKPLLLVAGFGIPALVFTGVTFFPDHVPATFAPGIGLTPFKKISEYVIICLLVLASAAYWRRMARTGDRTLVWCMAAFIICIFSEFVFTFYKSVFDTYNALGHIYKILAFSLIYVGTFATAVRNPWSRLYSEMEEHKRAKDEIRTLNTELEQRVAERTAQLEAANRELEAFSYSVSHDLRAPLRGVDGFARILVEEYDSRLDSEGKRIIGIIRDSAQEMGQLIDDILAFSRFGRREMRSALVQMHELARDVFDDVTRLEGERSFRFNLAPLPPAQGDPALIRQVVQNLLSNSVKYTRPREVAEIEVGCLPGETEHVYYFRDNGVGFDLKYSDKLFGVFQRLHGVEEFEGTGVGLAIAQRIVLRHGGRIWAESEKGSGATFFFTLPPADAPVSGAAPDSDSSGGIN